MPRLPTRTLKFTSRPELFRKEADHGAGRGHGWRSGSGTTRWSGGHLPCCPSTSQALPAPRGRPASLSFITWDFPPPGGSDAESRPGQWHLSPFLGYPKWTRYKVSPLRVPPSCILLAGGPLTPRHVPGAAVHPAQDPHRRRGPPRGPWDTAHLCPPCGTACPGRGVSPTGTPRAGPALGLEPGTLRSLSVLTRVRGLLSPAGATRPAMGARVVGWGSWACSQQVRCTCFPPVGRPRPGGWGQGLPWPWESARPWVAGGVGHGLGAGLARARWACDSFGLEGRGAQMLAGLDQGQWGCGWCSG